ncbi:MAG: hypothetical protein GWN67_20650 [Phycisphaerae bacterium]|nr:hypothetical protein [Phycisphaerae bacterium]NIS53375.1 hypothetical protein [Phycisphaerae bacterium]NIU08567.1 hypothetical protein [Phycisphaerae bacterium]NIU58702.1 hypothetical protein [Phycisphaerae bacterium]NIW94988.1 hypothetical protein [Phycisphaerae bacterium]
MKNLTEAAHNRLDKYLSQARASLHTCPGVDADEVESDIRAHIETELDGIDEPVSPDNLEAVLERLGSPTQWVPEEEISWWRKMILRLRTGPEDWRLAYISFGLLILGFLIPPSFIVLLPASFIIARAALSEAENPEELKTQKWLIYPSLIIVYVSVLLGLLLWPLGLLFPLAVGLEHTIRESNVWLGDDLYYWRMATSFIIAGLALWWTILGCLLLKWRRFIQMLFKPFTGWFSRKWALILLLIGLALMIPSFGLGIWYWFGLSFLARLR